MAGKTLEQIAARAKSGKPYVVVQLKEALADRPVDEAFGLYCRLLGIDEPGPLRKERAGSLLEAARDRAKFHIETEHGGETYRNKASKVIGEGNPRDLVCRSRTGFVTCFANAKVACLSSAIALDGERLFDFEDWEFAQIDDQLELDSQVFRSDGRDIWCMESAVPDMEIERAFTLNGCHTRAFGHWMWEYLPRYVEALAAGVMPPMPVLIDNGMPAQHREALETLLPPDCEAIEVPLGAAVLVKELWCAPSPVYMPLNEKINEKYRWDVFCSPPWRFKKIVERMAAAMPGGTGARRLFLARPESNHRKLINARAIEAIAAAHGFETVHPEQLTFREQVRLMTEAEAVVGPEGSAMFLSYYLKAGAKLAILSHPDIEGLATFTAIIEAAGIDASVLTGPFHQKNEQWPQFSDYTIEEERFGRFLETWLAAPA